MERHQLTEADIDIALVDLKHLILEQAKSKGMGVFVNRAEIEGRTVREFRELQRAIDERSPDEEVLNELLDVAVCAVWGVVSIYSGKCEG